MSVRVEIRELRGGGIVRTMKKFRFRWRARVHVWWVNHIERRRLAEIVSLDG